MKNNNNYYDQHLASFATCKCTCRFSILTLADLDETWSPNIGETDRTTLVKVPCGNDLDPIIKIWPFEYDTYLIVFKRSMGIYNDFKKEE